MAVGGNPHPVEDDKPAVECTEVVEEEELLWLS